MKEYEIRIFKPDGTPSLIIAEIHLKDSSAIGSARRLARDKPAEVWRGVD